jgi:hypothetical protein
MPNNNNGRPSAEVVNGKDTSDYAQPVDKNTATHCSAAMRSLGDLSSRTRQSITPASSQHDLNSTSLSFRLYMARVMPRLQKTKKLFTTYAKFIGPGFMIAVAYSM